MTARLHESLPNYYFLNPMFDFSGDFVGANLMLLSLAKIMSGEVGNRVACTFITPCATYSHFLGHFLLKCHLVK